jgi:hypothetical protein
MVGNLIKIMAAIVVLVPACASAALVHYKVTFSANSFSTFNNDTSVTDTGIASTDPVEGMFTIAFDDALDYTNETAGIQLVSLNILLGSPISFNYNSTTQRLEVGGTSNGANALFFAPPQNDFWLFINTFSLGGSAFDQVGYAQVADGNLLNFTLDQTGTVSVEAVPVPGVVSLMVVALAGLGICRQARR